MNLSAPFIERPVATTLLTVALLATGVLAYFLLPIAALPQVDVPSLSIAVTYPGAAPEIMASAIAQPLERQFAVLPNVDEITSQNGYGASQITVIFDLSRTSDGAASDVQSAINAATGQLPNDLPAPPTYRKVNPAEQPIILLGVYSETLPVTTVDEYADTFIAQRLSQLRGIAQILIIGEQKYAPTIRVNPSAAASLGLGLDTIANAIASTTTQRPLGTLQGSAVGFAIGANSQIIGAPAFADQIIAYRNGAPVRVRDIGSAVVGPEQPLVASWVNGHHGVILAVERQNGANLIQLVDAVRAALPDITSRIPRAVNVVQMSDRSRSIRAAFRDVLLTLGFTVVLVVAVIFLFLRQLWATLIPAVAVPLSIVASFAFMYPLGYSLDNLSLMGLTLAVGLVVDDAVVMLENITRHVEEGMRPFEAAMRGAGEIGFTILSITISLIAVFLPIFLMAGVVGRMFREFAAVVAAAIVASALISLTLTPMMASVFLTGSGNGAGGGKAAGPGGATAGRFYRWSGRVHERIHRAYERSLSVVLRHRLLTMLLTVSLILVTAWLFESLPTGFFPNEDTGLIFISTQGAENISFEQLARRQHEVEAIVLADPDVESVASSIGQGGPQAASNSGRLFITLKARRRSSSDEVMARLRRRFAEVPGIQTWLQSVQNVRMGGRLSRAEYDYTLEDIDADEVNRFAPMLEARMKRMPALVDVATDQELAGSRVMLDINRDRAARLGVSIQTLQQTLYYAFGQRFATQLYAPLNTYHVVFQVEPRAQDDPSALHRIFLRSDGGGMVPLSEIARYRVVAGPLAINHTSQFPSVTLSFDLAPGASLGAAAQQIAAAERALHKPRGISARFTGTAGAFTAAERGQGMLIVAAVFVVYIVLGVLYESFIHPATILMSLPPASVGALAALELFHFDLSIVAVIGLIMLIGIVKKNAIMMIDFALVAQRTQGRSPQDAVYQAALLRFRPIMMTSLAAILSALPIALGLGAGAELRRPLGVCVTGGLIVSQFLTLYTVPVTFIYFERFSEWARERVGRIWRPAHQGPPRPPTAA